MTAYSAIADPTRRRILDLLRQRELPAGDVARHFTVSRPAISRHLRVLRSAGLVSERRHGRERIYCLNASPLRDVDSWLRRYERFWSNGLTNLKRYLELEAQDQHGTGTEEERSNHGQH